MPRPRDNQRSKVYRAEFPVEGLSGKRWWNLVASQPRLTTGNIGLPAVQRYLDDLRAQEWFTSRYGAIAVTVHHKAHGQATSYVSRIMLPPWARNEETVLHELAHCIVKQCGLGSEVAAHGPEFVATLLELFGHQAGANAARCLRRSLRTTRAKVGEPVRRTASPESRVAQVDVEVAARESA